jgi:hypothetical protein
VEDPAERDLLLGELAGDLLLPLGCVVMPAGIRAGRRSGRLVLEGPTGSTAVGLEPGALESLGLAPGQRGTVLIEANEHVLLGARGKRILVEVTGGIAGVLVDLRDIPLRLPERRELRRALLSRWQEAAWPGGTQ